MARWWEFAARFSEFNRRAHRALARQFKKHGGMGWRGGRHKDTALAKACTCGPSYVAKMLIQAGPCITGPGTTRCPGRPGTGPLKKSHEYI